MKYEVSEQCPLVTENFDKYNKGNSDTHAPASSKWRETLMPVNSAKVRAAWNTIQMAKETHDDCRVGPV